MSKKAVAQNLNGKTDKAVKTYLKILTISPGNSEAIHYINRWKNENTEYRFGAGYNFDYFSVPYSRRWHLSFLSFEQYSKRLSIKAQVNYGDWVRNNEQIYSNDAGMQYDFTAYPVITPSTYLYLNYAYAPRHVFPRHRTGVEIYQGLPFAMEVSAGYRFLYFDLIEKDEKIHIFTGSLSKGYRKFWFTFRTYLAPHNDVVSQTYQLSAKRFFSGKNDFVWLTFSMGSSPDDPSNIGDYDIYRLKSHKIIAGIQHRLYNHSLIQCFVGFGNEEYRTDKTRNRFEISLKYSYRLHKIDRDKREMFTNREKESIYTIWKENPDM